MEVSLLLSVYQCYFENCAQANFGAVVVSLSFKRAKIELNMKWV